MSGSKRLLYFRNEKKWCVAEVYHSKSPPIPQQVILLYSGKFSRVQFFFAEWFESPQKKFRGCNNNYLRFNAKKPHPPQALHVKYWCVKIPTFNFRVDCSALSFVVIR